MKTLYLAYPIDRAGTESVTWAIQNAVGFLKNRVLSGTGVLTYDPGRAWTVGEAREVSPELQEVNHKAIHSSDSMLVFAPVEVRSWGVPAEVSLAQQRGMNIAIVTDDQCTWAMPQGRNVEYFRVDPKSASANSGWDTAGLEALNWLADQPVPKSIRNAASNRLDLQFTALPRESPEEIKLPVRAYSDDAGLDLFVSEGVWVPAGGFVDIHSHLAVQLPHWSWGFLVGRSSTLRKKGLLVNPGIIDTGYRGELFAGVQNMRDKPVRVEAGERLAQLIILGNATRRVDPVMVGELASHPRGSQGFGSSGA